MSLVVFDDSDQERMRKVAKKYSTKSDEKTEESDDTEDKTAGRLTHILAGI